jgi:anthranilate phosphoribosyltransferase
MSHTYGSEAAFAGFVKILGRGPGRSRALTREEAREAFGIVLRGEADPHQIGAFLMLLRFRGEDADEITGMVEAARDVSGIGGPGMGVALDWPSYGAGRTRGAPWFLLSALALARSGFTVLMHGTNQFSGGIPVEAGLAALGMAPCAGVGQARDAVRTSGFAYLPIASMAPAMASLLGLRRLFGLRSPVNTVARLLNPADAPAGVDGVFHPAYIEVHLGVAERMRRSRLLVLKGGGGEAERVPLKPSAAHVWSSERGRIEMLLPAQPGLEPLEPRAETPEFLAAIWRGEAEPPTPLATVVATVALGLLAIGRVDSPETAQSAALEIWRRRFG